MALDVEKLGQGLDDYHASLEKHLGELAADFNVLQEFFHRLASNYGGSTAEQFKIAWGRTAEWFDGYMTEGRELSQFLEERINALKEQND